ncbi:MAG: glutaredoxin family protein [Bacillota bacterium]
MNILSKIKNLFSNKKVIYSSEICSDCQKAERFFSENNIDIEIKKIENQQYREELKEKYGKVLVPTIILGNNKFIGFEDNFDEIKSKLKLS